MSATFFILTEVTAIVLYTKTYKTATMTLEPILKFNINAMPFKNVINYNMKQSRLIDV